MNAPNILGINRTQDGSISVFEGGKHIMSIHKERITKRKHHWGRLGDMKKYKDYMPFIERPYDLIVECWSADDERAKKDEYHEELRKEFPLTDKTRIVEISHHLSHLYSCYPTSGFDKCAVMIIDSVGSAASHVKYDYPDKKNSDKLFEVASYYYCDGDEITCIKKQLHDRDPEKVNGLGNFYYKLTECIFKGEGNEGKVMGLAAYGDPAKLNLPDLIVEEGEVFIPEEWREMFKHTEYDYKEEKKTFQEKADFAAKGQEVFEKALVEIAHWLSKKTGLKDIAYAGGCALNCVANSKVLEAGYNVFIPPAPHDGGTSVGCAIYGAMKCFHLKNEFEWKQDYLGPCVDIENVTSIIEEKYPDLEIRKLDNLIEECANHLYWGKILCVYQSHSEFGPRALGNRSIIGDTRYAVNKFWINAFIKGREWFRPIAPFVLEEDVNEYFKFDRRSPFMLFTAYLQDKYKDHFPTIEHIDHSARIQTVSKADNAFIYDVMKKFKEKTGVGIIANTSFNGKDETMVETLEDAINCFIKHPIHYLVVPPYIISKKEEVRNPLQLKSGKV
ncbi:MAG: carbamoyltransferase C-terminal domain-containing protein [Ilyomonas sp.]